LDLPGASDIERIPGLLNGGRTDDDAGEHVRFVRFVYDPGYVTANVGPVTLCDGPGVRCG
jgi:hypothetical protein